MTREEVQRNFFLTIQRKVKCKLNEFLLNSFETFTKGKLDSYKVTIVMVTNSVTVVTLRKKWDIA